MNDMFKSVLDAMRGGEYPRYVLMKKEDAEEVFDKEFKHIPTDSPGVFKIQRNGTVTGKMIKVN